MVISGENRGKRLSSENQKMWQFKSNWDYNIRGEAELETDSVTGTELDDDEEEINLVEFEIADRTSNDSEPDDDEILVDESD